MDNPKKAISMLVTDVGDEMLETNRHQHPKDVTKISKLSPTSRCHQHYFSVVIIIGMS